MKNRIRFLTQAALIAALYAVLTLFSYALGLDKGVIQIRLSEALTLLPFVLPSATPGLFIGCILAGLLTAAHPLDIVFGSLATLIAAFATQLLKKTGKLYLAAVPPVLSNALVIPFVLAFVYHAEGGIPFFILSIFFSEAIVCFGLGLPFLYALIKRNKKQKEPR